MKARDDVPPAAPADAAVYRSLFEAYPDALLLVDADGRIVLANPAAATLTGYGVDELVGLPVDRLVPDAIRPRHAAYREAYGRAPRPRAMGTHVDLVARRRDGSEVMVEIALSPLHGQNLPYVVAAVRGIGDYPRVRQALQRARCADELARLSRIAVDSAEARKLQGEVPRAAAVALDVESCILYLVEPNGVDLRVASAAGSLADDEPDAVRRADPMLAGVRASAAPVLVTDFTAERRFPVPQRYLDARIASGLAVPLLDRERVVGVLSLRSRQAQRFGDDEVRFADSLANLLATGLQRAQTEEQLRHAQRLDSIGRLTGGIAHDFNNLLTIISGNLQVIDELPAIADDASAASMIGSALRATERAAELTGKLLAFSRRQRLQPTVVDAGALLVTMAGMLRRMLDQRISITCDTTAGGPSCVVDAGQLEAALLNIAINARDAMPTGGTLAFACREVDDVPRQLRVELGEALGPYVAIGVSDTGVGMSETVRARAFEPFFTTKEAGHGTGLGLATVYGFAKQSRGAVMLDSDVGRGTTVTLYLPRGERADPAAPSKDARRGDRLPRGLRVLVVEDDAEVRAVVMRFLHLLGCAATACEDAQSALGMLEPPLRFDVLFSDVALGDGMRGTELKQLVKHRLPGFPVLLTSGFASDGDAAGGDDILRKPYTRDELASAIARALAGG